MTDDELLFAVLEDKLNECESNNYIAFTHFLDTFQQSKAISYLARRRAKYTLFGGFEDAERKIVVFLPDYADEDYIKSDGCSPALALRIDKDNFSRLGHRDYLGAIMGLGIRREMLGDIVCDEKGCTVAVLESVAKYLCENLVSIGRGTVKVHLLGSFSEVKITENFTLKKCFVNSMRADSVIASCFSFSRGEAVRRLSAGEVFINGVQILKPDFKVPVGSKVVVRGKGKAVITEEITETKKGRQAFTVKKYE